ncbi:neuronal PAS domain-containing protein 2 [Drosophila hydei]|uniref:Neuronal PAS domain-containing protein 2 n=1 Tax=Drosophila hydei TaxID=7224 RepID=A0A6J1M9J0_DROHY|nr:neuronal PAS domain-containing protein 2 [Drosophila hydei]
MAAVVAATANGGSGCVAVMTAAAAAAAAVTDSETNDGSGASNGREARNLAEKQRRDKLNASIQELATMVPHAAESTRRLDKTAVLRFATHGLRLQYIFGKSATRRRRRLNVKAAGGAGPGASVGGGNGNAISAGDTPQLTDTLMQLLDSFFLTLTCNGQIVLVSGSVEQLLGHCQSDLYGQNLLQITHPDDQALLRQQLIPRDIETLFYQQRQCQRQRQRQQHTQSQSASDEDDDDDDDDGGGGAGGGDDDDEMEQLDQDLERTRTRTPSPQTIAHMAAIDERLRADRRCFTIRIARASTRAEATRHYEMVKIDGCFRRSDSSVTGGAAANYPIVSQLIRRSRNNNMLVAAAAAAAAATATNATAAATTLVAPCLPQHDAIAQAALHGISGNDIVLVAMARVMREDSTCLSLMCRQPEPYQLEYRTRHLIDGSIIDCDQRIGIVAGYMKDEVRNLSPFSFMHLDDVRWVIVALRQMYDCNSDYGESCYRLLSRNGHFIYLQTKGFLEIDKNSNKVHSFLCVNTLLDEQAGKQKVQEMKNKFSTIIKANIPTHTSPDLPASRAPQQLERIVLYLIENLQKSANGGTANGSADTNGNGHADVHMDAMDDICCSSSSPASSHATGAFDEQAPSPAPLALVPPAPGHVKHSISKSVNVVNVTSARNLQYQQQKQQREQQLELKQEQKQQERSAATGGVIRQLSISLSESSTLSPASASSLELPDDANSNTSPPPAARASVLQRLMTTTTPTTPKVAAVEAPLPPAQLRAALSHTLRSLDTKLTTIGEEVQQQKQQQQQCSALPPKYERQMDAILLEHQKQKQLLVNIKSEYDAVHHQTVSVITKQTTAATTTAAAAAAASSESNSSSRSNSSQ